MKKLKQLGALVLALMLAVALCCPAVAAGETTYTITINNAEPGHTYEAYQIFAGDLKVTDGKKILSNITWGNGITEAGKTALGDAATKAAALKNSADAATFAKDVAQYLTNATPSLAQADGTYTISGLSAGYYLVKDQDNTLQGKDDFATAYIMEVVGDVTATPKGDKPSVEKKVKDTNDTTGETSGWQDFADYDIGDSIPFQLTGTVASNYDAYETYKFIFHDVESDGLTFKPDTVNAYVVNGTDRVAIPNTNFNVKQKGDPATYDTNCTFEIEFSNLKQIADVKGGSKIVVEYEATLNEKAVIGSKGNPNKVSLEYSNNPNGEGTGKTPEDTVIVFTYKTVINKVDQDGNSLTGAAFKLEKKLADGTTKLVKEFKVNNTTTSFEFVGLDDGTYILTETATPEGYNSIAPITFEITAEHEILSATPTLTTLNGNKVSGEISFTSATSDGSLTANIVNRSGSTLPTTGGMGTTVLYVVGGALVVCAGVALVAKKRMQ